MEEATFEELPEPIVHGIMCSLPIKDAIRSSTLSTKFRSAWLSLPILDFGPVTFHEKPLPQSKLVSLDSVLGCLRQRTPNQSLDKFGLNLVFNDATTSDPRVDNVILMAAEKGVKFRELSLRFTYETMLHYNIPNKVFSLDSITLLDLACFQVNQPNLILDSPVMEELRLRHGSGLEEIQVLSRKLKRAEFEGCAGLQRIEIKSSTLESFKQIQKNDEKCVIEIAACESVKNIALDGSSVTDGWAWENFSKFLGLEYLQLKDCGFITYVYVLSDRLKLVEVKGCNVLKRIAIKSPSLEAFEYEIGARERGECEISILRCKFLKNLVLVGASITDSWFIDHMAQFILLESLKLKDCYLLKKIMISDHKTLRSLVLEGCSSRDLELECWDLNLNLFKYDGVLISSPPIVAGNLHAEVSLQFGANVANVQLTIKYKNLRDFLASFGLCKTLTLSVNQAFIFPDEVRRKMLPPLYDMNHLKLKFSWDSIPVVKLVDSVLWLAPMLGILTLATDEYGDITIKLHYDEEIMDTEEEEDSGSCCFKRPLKCWRHNLTKVGIENLKCGDDTSKSLISFFFNMARTLEEVSVDGEIHFRNFLSKRRKVET